MLVASALIVFFLIGRMFYLQIIKGSYYSRQAEGNRTRYTRILAPRGIIYDCNGEELANNQPGFMVSLAHRNTGYRDETIERLSELVHIPVDKIKETINLHGGSAEPIRIVRNAPPDVVAKVEENLRYLPDVMIEVQPVRTYPNKELAVHALGYVGEVSEYEIEQGVYENLKAGDIIGKFGLKAIMISTCAVRTAVTERKSTSMAALSRSWTRWNQSLVKGWCLLLTLSSSVSLKPPSTGSSKPLEPAVPPSWSLIPITGNQGPCFPTWF